jgi:hypothetical protein
MRRETEASVHGATEIGERGCLLAWWKGGVMRSIGGVREGGGMSGGSGLCVTFGFLPKVRWMMSRSTWADGPVKVATDVTL